MKNLIINKTMNFIIQNNNYDKTTLEEIRYGLVTIYLTFSKLIIIGILASILGLFKEMIIFLIIYNILRCFSFGLHATKSWICLLVSTIILIGGTYLCLNIYIDKIATFIISLITICLIYKYSPADTKKKPIVNPKRRKIFKYLSTLIAFTFYILSLIIKNQFIVNCLILSLIIQSIMINPITYKIFNLPYNNYKNFKFD